MGLNPIDKNDKTRQNNNPMVITDAKWEEWQAEKEAVAIRFLGPNWEADRDS